MAPWLKAQGEPRNRCPQGTGGAQVGAALERHGSSPAPGCTVHVLSSPPALRACTACCPHSRAIPMPRPCMVHLCLVPALQHAAHRHCVHVAHRAALIPKE